jgi:6-phosphogluconate dehydrogenase
MQLGYIGLGKMGLNMVERLLEHGHRVVAYDLDEDARAKAERAGAKVVRSLAELVRALKPPRTIWVMVPSTSPEAVDGVLHELLKHVHRGDTIVEGGNSFYELTVKRARRAAAKGIRFLDAGVSGGPRGARDGACVMVGGEKKDYKKLEKLFRDISRGKGYYLYAGRHGAGHFVKMVHNGIEYGMMQALAEGFEVLKKGPYKLDLGAVAELYNHGSVIESRLVGWLVDAYGAFGRDLKRISGSVGHTGEGEWTIKIAQKLGVAAPVMEDAFKFRVQSKKRPSYAGKVLSALRNQFGGHSAKR